MTSLDLFKLGIILLLIFFIIFLKSLGDIMGIKKKANNISIIGMLISIIIILTSGIAYLLK